MIRLKDKCCRIIRIKENIFKVILNYLNLSLLKDCDLGQTNSAKVSKRYLFDHGSKKLGMLREAVSEKSFSGR